MKKWWAVLLASLGLALAAGITGAQEPAGADLAQRLECFACHSQQGGASPLEGLGARWSRQDLEIMLTYPRRLRPGAKMPSYAYLPAGERQALLDYLLDQK